MCATQVLARDGIKKLCVHVMSATPPPLCKQVCGHEVACTDMWEIDMHENSAQWYPLNYSLVHDCVHDMVCSIELEKDRRSTFHKILHKWFWASDSYCVHSWRAPCALWCVPIAATTQLSTPQMTHVCTHTNALTCTLLYSLTLIWLPSYVYTFREGAVFMNPPSPYSPSNQIPTS